MHDHQPITVGAADRALRGRRPSPHTGTSRPAPALGPVLNPRLPVLLRPSGGLQVGCDPSTAVLVRPPHGITSLALAELLRSLDGSRTRADVVQAAADRGAPAAELEALLDELSDADVIDTSVCSSPPAERGTQEGREQIGAVRVHGRGPLSDAIASGLSGLGVRTSRSGFHTVATAVDRWQVGLVVLADDLVPDPRLVTDLIACKIPHLPVRIRDGRGIIGPLVLPGQTSCLRCADLFRRDRDPDWPHLAAQLLGTAGVATPPTVLATAALALGELETVIAAWRDTGNAGRRSPDRAPITLNATLELDLEKHTLNSRKWAQHPLCRCWSHE